MPCHVFISHAHADKSIADRLIQALEDRNIKCWVAPRDVPAGGSYAAAILAAIENSYCLVLIYTARANVSRHVLREIERALNFGIELIPIRFDDSVLSKSLDYLLATVQWLPANLEPTETAIANAATQITAFVASKEAVADTEARDALGTGPIARNAAIENTPDDQLFARLQSYVPKQLAEKIRSSGHVEGERRQVTVVFAGISGFAELSERLDAEEVTGCVNACFKELVDAVYQYEGMVDKFLGESIMAVFGAPVAFEDDAERALRAALMMRARLEDFNRHRIDKLGEELNLHIGVNSGAVIAGNVGSDLRMSYTVMGDTVNIASRLQDAADRGQIFVSHNTRRLTRGAFTFRAMEPIRLKGKSDQVPVYELIAAKIQPGKARGVTGLFSPLVGREWECKALIECITGLRLGHRAIAMIYGDAGVGKSRLVAEVQRRESKGVTWLEGRCFATSHTLSYGPFLDLLRRHLGLADEYSDIEQRAVLHDCVRETFPDSWDVYPVLAQLLALGLDDSDEQVLKQLKGEAFRNRLFEIIVELLSQLDSRGPVVVLIEDLHWADESSIVLLNHLIALTGAEHLAIIGTRRTREEPLAHWAKLAPALEQQREYLIEIELKPLPFNASRALVEHLLGGNYLPQTLSNQILDKSEGNPFFLEEVLQSLIERGVLVREGQGWMVGASSETIRVPDTLQGLLLSRLDQLPEDLKKVVQKAAVIGRIFLYRLLEQLVRGDRLDADLASLQGSGLVREYSRLPEVEYAFKHALTKQVAYQTLLGPARKALHRKVGEAIELIFGPRLQEFSGVLGYHYFSAECWEKALEYLVRSADAGFRVCAYAEARGHCSRALECLSHLGTDPEHLQQRIDLTIELVGASLLAESPEKNLARLMEVEPVAQSLADPVRLGRVQLWIGRAHYYATRFREAMAYFQKVVILASDLRDPELMALPGAAIARVLFMQGQFKESVQFLDQALPLLEAAQLGHEMLFAHMIRGIARTCLGHYAAGMSDLNGALEIARANRDQNAEAMAHTGLAIIQLVAGGYEEGVASAGKALEVAEKSGDAFFRYTTNSCIAWGTLRLGHPKESLPYWATGREAAKPMGGRLILGDWFAAFEAEALLGSGDPEAALRRAEEALALAQTAGSTIGEALAECAIGRALAATVARREEAQGHVAKATELLETMGAKYDLARAILAQTEVHLACGDRAAAAPALKKAAAICHEYQLTREELGARALMSQLGAT